MSTKQRRDLINIFAKHHEMNIVVGQGEIALATLAHVLCHEIATLPANAGLLKLAGYPLLVLGLVFSGRRASVSIGLLQSQSVNAEATGLVCDPVYSSMTFYILLVVPAVLGLGGVLFVQTEAGKTTQAFGKECDDCLVRVDRLMPFRKP